MTKRETGGKRKLVPVQRETGHLPEFIKEGYIPARAKIQERVGETRVTSQKRFPPEGGEGGVLGEGHGGERGDGLKKKSCCLSQGGGTFWRGKKTWQGFLESSKGREK